MTRMFIPVALALLMGCASQEPPQTPIVASAPGTTAPWWAPPMLPTWALPGAGPGSRLPLSPFEREVVRLVNQQRAQGATCGGEPFGPKAPLTVTPALVAAARGHSWDMAARNYMDHRSRDGRTVGDRVHAAGFHGRTWGENIARGHRTPNEVVIGWMQSPGHCSNIMSPRFRFIGVGYVFNPIGDMKHNWTQNFGG